MRPGFPNESFGFSSSTFFNTCGVKGHRMQSANQLTGEDVAAAAATLDEHARCVCGLVRDRSRQKARWLRSSHSLLHGPAASVAARDLDDRTDSCRDHADKTHISQATRRVSSRLGQHIMTGESPPPPPPPPPPSPPHSLHAADKRRRFALKLDTSGCWPAKTCFNSPPIPAS